MNFKGKFQSKLGKKSFKICINFVIPQIQLLFMTNSFHLKSESLLVFFVWSKMAQGHLGCLYWPHIAF